MPKVSVLMSNYNTRVDWLKKSIDSALNQTYKDFEIVIVDDGSTDESLDLLLEYEKNDSRIVLVKNEKNIGLASSLNRGLDTCKGEYIARMDTDDICYPDRLEKQVEFMDNNPTLILAGAWADTFGDDENIIVENWQPKSCPHDEYRIRILFGNSPLIIHPTVIYRRALLDKYNLRYDTDVKYKYSEDYRMWVRCSKYGNVGIFEYSVIKYRNANTDSRITIRHQKEMRKCIQYVQAEQFEKLNIELTDDMFEYNFNLLSGRKPYDLTYKKWINTILYANKKYKVYNHSLLRKMLFERWYNITYYGIAYEKSLFIRLKYFIRLYTSQKIRFLTELFK